MKNNLACIVCKSNDWKKYFGNKLVQCNNCSFVRAKNKYFQVDSRKIYSKKYYKGDDYLDYEKEKRALEKNFKDRLKRIKNHKKEGKLLEIGCAYGYFLNIAKKNFEVTGIDLDEEIVKKAQKVSGSKIIQGDFLEIDFKKSHFDVVCMFDVIEHLKMPEEYIKKIYKILKPNGILVIETGDVGSILAQIQKGSWRLITPPFHLQYFSKKTIKKLLFHNKFEVKTIDYVTFNRSLAQMIYRSFKAPFLKNISHNFFGINIPLNTYDLMFVIAKK